MHAFSDNVKVAIQKCREVQQGFAALLQPSKCATDSKPQYFLLPTHAYRQRLYLQFTTTPTLALALSPFHWVLETEENFSTTFMWLMWFLQW